MSVDPSASTFPSQSGKSAAIEERGDEPECTVPIGHDAQQVRLYARENHLGDRGRIQDRT